MKAPLGFLFFSLFSSLINESLSPVPLTHQQTPKCSLLDFQVICGFHEILRGLFCASANVMWLLGEDIQETGLFVLFSAFMKENLKKQPHWSHVKMKWSKNITAGEWWNCTEALHVVITPAPAFLYDGGDASSYSESKLKSEWEYFNNPEGNYVQWSKTCL